MKNASDKNNVKIDRAAFNRAVSDVFAFAHLRTGLRNLAQTAKSLLENLFAKA